MKNVMYRIDQLKNEDISYIVKDIIQYKLGLEENQLHESANFQDDLGIDSLDLIELRMEIEKQFGISIQDEELENLRTVGSMISYLSDKKG
jgi:acyl carrier protein